MRTINRRHLGILVCGAVIAMVACVPSNYEGSGSVGTADFTYAGDNCQGDIRGHFNWNDTTEGVVFHAEMVGYTQGCSSCAYCAEGEDEMVFTYQSRGKDGQGVGCYTNNIITLLLTSGLHEGYYKSGPVENVAGGVGTPCD